MPKPQPKLERRYRLVRDVVETITLTILIFLVIRLAIQNFNISGMSMEPSLHDQELVLVDKWSYLFHAPARGDVIVFQAPQYPDQDYIKRIIGLPGDVITIKNTTVYVDGTMLKEPYVDPGHQGNPFGSFANRVVPPNAYFVLGDNRGDSSDSRDWGCVPRGNIVGRAAFVYWPFGSDNFGLLPNETSNFDNIHQPKMAATNTNTCPISTPLPQSDIGTLIPNTAPGVNMDLLLFTPGTFAVCLLRKRRQRR